jgi:hypothetical protein
VAARLTATDRQLKSHLACNNVPPVQYYTGPPFLCGCVVLLPSGLPARTGAAGGGKPSSSKIYQRSGAARRVVRERHPRGKVIRAFAKAASDMDASTDMLIGFCILDAAGKVMRTGYGKHAACRLYEHLGFARKAARAFGAASVARVVV